MSEQENKQKQIHEKGFLMSNLDFGSMKVERKNLEDIAFDLGALKAMNKKYTSKNEVLNALAERKLEDLREISELFYRTSGIYFRVCNYFAQMYRYDWYISPEVYDTKTKADKITKEFTQLLSYLDNSQVKKLCNKIALTVIKSGAYYGCVMEGKNGIILQDLPPRYCRSRYYVGNNPVIELNLQFFDNMFADAGYRTRVLKSMPQDIQKGYVLWKKGKLKDEKNMLTSWYVLEPGSAIKFDFGNGDIPLFASAIPAIIDLDMAQDLDRRKQMQKLLKIIVQQLPLDKNNDLIFDVDEARDIHNNAVAMLSNAIGVDVLTTFADIKSVDISDRTTTTTTDELERVERTLYNAFGIPQNIFNATGNIALSSSILNDESLCRNLLLQFNSFFDSICQKQSKNSKKYKFRFYMLETTQYNYKDLSKLYKEQVQIGYSKMLPQIALGHSQSFILNSCHFENEILKLHEIMIPPLMSSTMSSEDVLGRIGNSNTNKNQNSIEGTSGKGKIPVEEKSSGRPEKPDSEKSDKTLANRESLG